MVAGVVAAMLGATGGQEAGAGQEMRGRQEPLVLTPQCVSVGLWAAQQSVQSECAVAPTLQLHHGLDAAVRD